MSEKLPKRLLRKNYDPVGDGKNSLRLGLITFLQFIPRAEREQSSLHNHFSSFASCQSRNDSQALFINQTALLDSAIEFLQATKQCLLWFVKNINDLSCSSYCSNFTDQALSRTAPHCLEAHRSCSEQVKNLQTALNV